MALALHLIPLIKRIEYSTYLNNPLIDEIKSNLIVAYELAVKATDIINKQYQCHLPEDEIAYFALHINLSLEQSKKFTHKNTILLVCASGGGSAKLLEYYFKENFSDYINKLEVCSLYELNNKDILKYDCIFTTVPLNQEMRIPVFQINYFMNEKDYLKVKNSFRQLKKQNIIKYFPKSIFYEYDSFKTKEEAIREIVKRCRKYYDLPDNFEKEVLKREKLASTELGSLVAFPHTQKPMSHQTFVSVVILKKPMLWNERKIRIIMLSSIEKSRKKDLNDFYDFISYFMTHQTLQWQIIHNPSYDFFKEIIEKGQTL